LFFVELLEDGALVPRGALESLQGLPEVFLRDVEHPDLEHLIRFAVVDQVVEASPRALELLHVGVMEDLVDLIAQLAIELCDDGLDVLDRVVRRDLAAGEGLRRERANGALDLFARAVGLGLELLVEERREVVRRAGRGFRGGLRLFLLFGHGTHSPFFGSVSGAGFGAAARVSSKPGSWSRRAMSS